SPEPRRGREKAAYLVAERTVIRVLLDRHELDRVVPCPCNPRQDVLRKLAIRPDPLLLQRHSHVRLVNPQTASYRRRGVLPRERLRRIPVLSRKSPPLVADLDLPVIGGDAIPRPDPGDDMNLDAALVPQPRRIFSIRQKDGPDPELIALHRVRAA